MMTAFAALVLVALGQGPDAANDARVKEIAPFVSPDVFAVIHVDVARLDVPKLSARVFGDVPPGVMADGRALVLRWSEGLKTAGAKDLYALFSIIDMPGRPLVIVPLAGGAQAEGIARTIDGDATPIHNAIVSGTAEAVARVKNAAAPEAPRVELSAAFQAFAGDSAVIRLFVLPSAESRRVLEEMVPMLPEELGGGPMTDLTRGLLWAAAGIDDAAKPAFRLVAGSRDAQAAAGLKQLADKLIDLLRGSPDIEKSVPGLAKALAELKPTAAGDRVTLSVDARQAGAIFDAVTAPAREAAVRAQCTNNEKQIMLAMHNYHDVNGSFPPAFSRGKDGKPLLSWRVLLLPFLDQKALYDQFHLDEAWDSPHNRALVSKMPEVFHCPAEKAALAAEGKTRYLGARGAGTVLRGGRNR